MLDLTDMRKNVDAAADLLDRAAAILEERGWCRGEYTDRAGRLCAMGAIGESMVTPAVNKIDAWSFRTAEQAQAISILANWLQTEGHRVMCPCGGAGCQRNAITGWNDHACDKAEDVIYGLQKAAISARELVV